MPRITDRRRCRRRAECCKQGGIGFPCSGRTRARGCKRTHAAFKMAQWMTNGIFRALEFFAVFNSDAMSTVSGGATHRGCQRAPQAGRANVRQGGFAHFGQHKHRAAHAEWAQQRAVAGFVDACVEKWHVGRVRGDGGRAEGGSGRGAADVAGSDCRGSYRSNLRNFVTLCDGCTGVISFVLMKDVCSSCSSIRRVSFRSPRHLH